MYETCIFDLYGTLVDIHTDEEKEELWERLALFYAFYGAAYTPGGLRAAYRSKAPAREESGGTPMRRFRRYRSRTSSGRFSWRRGQRRTSLWCGTRVSFSASSP